MPLLLVARLLQLPITLPTFCFTRLLPTVRAYLYSSTEVDRKVPLQQKKLTTQTLVAETSKSRKNVVVGAVLDEVKKSYKKRVYKNHSISGYRFLFTWEAAILCWPFLIN